MAQWLSWLFQNLACVVDVGSILTFGNIFFFSFYITRIIQATGPLILSFSEIPKGGS